MKFYAAGLPEAVIKRARAILRQMEQQAAAAPSRETDSAQQFSFASMQQEKVIQMLQKTNLQELSDAECREFLEDLMQQISIG